MHLAALTAYIFIYYYGPSYTQRSTLKLPRKSVLKRMSYLLRITCTYFPAVGKRRFFPEIICRIFMLSSKLKTPLQQRNKGQGYKLKVFMAVLCGTNSAAYESQTYK